MNSSFKRFRKRLSSWLQGRRSSDQEPSSKHNRKTSTPASTRELTQPLDASSCAISLLPQADASQAQPALASRSCSHPPSAQVGPSPATLRSQSLMQGPSGRSNRILPEEAAQRSSILELQQELRDAYVQLADVEAEMEQCAKDMDAVLSEYARAVDVDRELCRLEKKLERLNNTAPPNELVSVPKSKQI